MVEQIGVLGWPLLCLSLLAVMFVVERMVFFARLPKGEASDLHQTLLAELNKNSALNKPIRDELVSLRLMEVRETLEFGIRFLRFIAVISPMLGLLGTVLGMIEAFRVIAANTGPVEPAAIADGLWSAMLTTACGLFIALPCLLAAFIFSRMAEKRLSAMQLSLNKESLQMEGVVLS